MHCVHHSMDTRMHECYCVSMYALLNMCMCTDLHTTRLHAHVLVAHACTIFIHIGMYVSSMCLYGSYVDVYALH
jgi:hypothetical protein